MAVEAVPSSPSYALNLMHALELEQAYSAAVAVAISFCRATTCACDDTFMSKIGYTQDWQLKSLLPTASAADPSVIFSPLMCLLCSWAKAAYRDK